MKAYYKQRMATTEKAVAFRTKSAAFCLLQSTLYGRMPKDDGVVYLDFENEEQIDKLINTLQSLKDVTNKSEEETKDENQ